MSAVSDPRSILLRPFYPSLDGLRAIAILLIFWIHFGGTVFASQVFQWGWIGVDIFFVLSGFLITGILFDSLNRTDFFSNFYIRRALRIFPLYYAMWIFFLLLGCTPWIHILWNRYDFTLMAYVGNLFIPGGRAGHHPDINSLSFLHRSGATGQILIGQLWSLCVEEQFYFIWPAVVWWVRSRRKLLAICIVVIVAEPVLRALCLHWFPHTQHDEGIYVNTFFRADTLLMGAAVALWLRGSNPSLLRVRGAAYSLVFVSSLVLFIACKFEMNRPKHIVEDPMVLTVGFTLVALASAGLLLLTIDPAAFPARVLRHPLLLWIGRISYGLYILHGPITGMLATKAAFFRHHHARPLAPVIATLITFGLGWLSFQFLESPFLDLKSRFAPRHGAADDPPPYLRPQHTEA